MYSCVLYKLIGLLSVFLMVMPVNVNVHLHGSRNLHISISQGFGVIWVNIMHWHFGTAMLFRGLQYFVISYQGFSMLLSMQR